MSTDHRLVLTDADKREELKVKALQSIDSSLYGIFIILLIVCFLCFIKVFAR